MNWVRPCTILTALLLGACGGMPDCQKPQLYQEAVPGKRIELLDGMDNLSADRELKIPEASLDAPPPPGECLDAPPTMRTASDEG